MMSRAVLSLGSNLGDRLAQLQGALDGLSARGIRIIAVSPVYETDPVGGPEQDDYLNAVVVVDTDLDARGLLSMCQSVEAEHDRVREVRWGPRTLDIDIVDFDGVVLDDPDLTLPHPRAAERAFVCAPWLDADPSAVLLGGPVAALVLDHDGVRQRPDLSLHGPGQVKA
jgi:2-amino-4-hydroxy-6-hydroxymethyldihydropteridine diphosphokinase